MACFASRGILMRGSAIRRDQKLGEKEMHTWTLHAHSHACMNIESEADRPPVRTWRLLGPVEVCTEIQKYAHVHTQMLTQPQLISGKTGREIHTVWV